MDTGTPPQDAIVDRFTATLDPSVAAVMIFPTGEICFAVAPQFLEPTGEPDEDGDYACNEGQDVLLLVSTLLKEDSVGTLARRAIRLLLSLDQQRKAEAKTSLPM